MRHTDPKLHDIIVTVTDPNGNQLSHTLTWKEEDSSEALGVFTPAASGKHLVCYLPMISDLKLLPLSTIFPFLSVRTSMK